MASAITRVAHEVTSMDGAYDRLLDVDRTTFPPRERFEGR
jgi:hypothetical protein